ncbi:hypothetical protein DACRYDRAFT_118358 [Dacryopinax primogenitus]|uniref:Mid2 domain-containing protein n=1 Tax=Dacryopinax primogenitus (strain DJM 731) TaxID=1858805 RepID=M5FZV1_DACPD|nr:uncharacterized protein DACRYDRAFT_118358 [Dacryopinax primogenitus]EJT99086.1 hypothetical protein DACRYDRAFT_118358 [Dacryopinax primogenitus]
MLGLVLALLVGGANAQTSTNATCASTYDWMSNAEGQSPCLVAAGLQGVCNNNKWFIPSLPSGTHYVGPTSPSLGTLCICNTVVYNLVSACAACQGGEWVAWADWTSNCSVSVMTRGSFPGPVPGGTSIPAWAEVDTSLEGTWNAIEARGVAGSALPDTFPSSTASTTSTATATSTSPPSDSSKPNIGAIVGGVLGGIALLLIAILVFLFLRRRSKRRTAAAETAIPLPASYSSLSSRNGNDTTPPPNGQGYSGPHSPGGEKSAFLAAPAPASPPFTPTGTSPLSPGFPIPNNAPGNHNSQLKLYDPQGPSTWPTNIPLPVLTSSSNGTAGSVSSQAGTRTSTTLSASGYSSQPQPSQSSSLPPVSELGPSAGNPEMAVLDSDRAYSPVPTPAPTYRSSASPGPGGDRVIMRGPARQMGKRRPR